MALGGEGEEGDGQGFLFGAGGDDKMAVSVKWDLNLCGGLGWIFGACV